MECDLKIRGMERLAINELLKWKNKEYRKPLIVEGARQVGKTWLVKEFAAPKLQTVGVCELRRYEDPSESL